jgi:hypothetical protein
MFQIPSVAPRPTGITLQGLKAIDGANRGPIEPKRQCGICVPPYSGKHQMRRWCRGALDEWPDGLGVQTGDIWAPARGYTVDVSLGTVIFVQFVVPQNT